jgi:hypothetical protein
MIRINGLDFAMGGRKQGATFLQALLDAHGDLSLPYWKFWAGDCRFGMGLIDWILHSLPKHWVRNGSAKTEFSVRGLLLDPERLEIRIAVPGPGIAVVGSPVSGGINIVLVRGADGQYQIEIETYIERLVCRNGMTRRTSRKRLCRPGDCLEDILAEVLGDMAALQSEICRSLTVYVTSQAREVVHIARTIERIQQETRVDARLFSGVYCAFMEEPGTSMFHLANAISRAANQIGGVGPDYPQSPGYMSEGVGGEDATPLPGWEGSGMTREAAYVQLQRVAADALYLEL